MGRGTQQLPGLIIFDLDGTIIDTEPTSMQMWVASAKEFGLDLTLEQAQQFIGLNNEAVGKLAAVMLGTDISFDAIFTRKRELSRQILDQGFDLKTGVMELLDTLDELGIPSCIATSSGKERSERYLKKAGLLDRFQFLISGEEVTHSKPHPEIFLRCIEKAGIEPGASMVVEDSRNGIIGARSSGAIPVLIPDIVPPDAEMIENADFLFDSLLGLRDYLLTLKEA